MSEQLSLIPLETIERGEENPLANEVWAYAVRLKFDAQRFKRFVVAGWMVERYDREEFLRAKDESLMPLMRRLALIEEPRHFPQADERTFWSMVGQWKVPHPEARALTQKWSFDGFCDWAGAVEEMIYTHGFLAESKTTNDAAQAA